MTMRPLMFDLFCGLGGWAEGGLSEGYDVVGFDIERRPYPGSLVLQDVTTLHGAQLRDATLIVASPPCQEFSYRAMPWKRAKALPPPFEGVRLFWSCWRIQHEACEAAQRYIPLVVENVKGAQPWVGRARAHFGSYYLWGDVGMCGTAVVAGGLRFGGSVRTSLRRMKYQADCGPRMWRDREVVRLNDGGSTKNDGGSWFNIAHNTVSGVANNPVMNLTNEALGRKGNGGGWFTAEEGRGKPGHWKESGCVTRRFSSRSAARKEASALIAKIPFELARYVAQSYLEAEQARDNERAAGDARCGSDFLHCDALCACIPQAQRAIEKANNLFDAQASREWTQDELRAGVMAAGIEVDPDDVIPQGVKFCLLRAAPSQEERQWAHQVIKHLQNELVEPDESCFF